MNIGEARNAIYTHFINQWANRTALTLVNEIFDPPASDAWVRLSVQNTLGEQETIAPVGERMFKRRGLIFVQVYTLSDTGLSESDTLTHAALSIIEGMRISDIFIFTSTIRELEADGKWFQSLVETDFFYLENR